MTIFPRYPAIVRHTALMLIAIGVTVLNGCKSLPTDLLKGTVKKPTATIEEVKVAGMNFDSVDLELYLNIYNPNSYKLALSGYDYDVKLNNLDMIKGETSEGFHIPARSADIVRVPLSVGFKDIVKLYKELGDDGTISYDATVGVKLDAPILNLLRMETRKQGDLDIPRIPRISLGDLKVNKFSFTEIDLAFTMDVDNPNSFALDIKDIIYKINVAGNPWVEGGVDQVISIKEKQTSTIQVPFKVKLSDLGSGLIKSLRKGNFKDFGIEAGFTVDSEHKAFKNLRVPLNYNP